MSEAVPNFVNGVEVGRYSQIGVVTPDHAIRNKRTPLVVPAPEAGQGKAFREEAGKAAEKYVADYRTYFARHDGVREPPRKSMDPMPRVVMVPGLGLFGVENSAGAARIVADLADNSVRVITDAEAIGAYRPVDEAATLDIEYWSLEQVKLSEAAERPLASAPMGLPKAATLFLAKQYALEYGHAGIRGRCVGLCSGA